MIDEVIETLEAELESTVGSFVHDLGRVRTGRANAALLDAVMVDYYGAATHLNQLASINVPESRLLVVQPFDQATIPAIEKAISVADLGLNPSNDGKLIRLSIPELTEERRRDLVKQVGREAENHRVSLRSHRRDANDMLKQLNSDKDISDDELRGAQGRVQELTDNFVKKVDEIAKVKEEEVMAV